MFVRCVGEGVLGYSLLDVAFSVTGEIVVSDCAGHRVCVFSPESGELVRSFGAKGTGDGQFDGPAALAAAGKHLYVLDWDTSRVQVFE